MGNPAGVRRDFAALEERRMEGAQLLKQGVSQSEVPNSSKSSWRLSVAPRCWAMRADCGRRAGFAS